MADCTKYQEMISAGIDSELTEEQQAENDENVLSDLTAFF